VTNNIALTNSPLVTDHYFDPAVDRVGVAVVAGRRGLYAVADYARNVPMLTQAQIDTRVAAMMQGHGVTVAHGTNAAREACKTNDGVPKAESGGRTRFVMRWQDAELVRLPSELSRELASGKFSRAEVASCPAKGQQGWFTAYRIAVLLY